MAEKNIDKLLSLTDSKYRLSVVIAKRAVQISVGFPSVLPAEKRVRLRNHVSLAMAEFASEKLTWGEHLVDEENLQRLIHNSLVEQREVALNKERDSIQGFLGRE